MAKNKTTQTAQSVTDFVHAIADEAKRTDCFAIIQLMQAITGFEPNMWGPSIIGFGTYHYKYESGHEGDMAIVCFSPRKAAIVLYLSACFEGRVELLAKLGKHTSGKGCIYIKKLADVDLAVLHEMIMLSVKHVNALYPA